jgi:hypothetical protein
MQPPLKQPFSNAQLELLKVFSINLSDEQLLALKKHLSNFLLDEAIKQADKVWDENNWTEETVEELLNTRLRRSRKDKE